MGVVAFQGLFLLFSFGALWGVREKWKLGAMSGRAAGFWSLLWIVGDAVVLFPQSATLIANQLGIGRGTDFVLYVSVVVILFALFRLQVKMETINREMTKVVREQALRKEEKI